MIVPTVFLFNNNYRNNPIQCALLKYRPTNLIIHMRTMKHILIDLLNKIGPLEKNIQKY